MCLAYPSKTSVIQGSPVRKIICGNLGEAQNDLLVIKPTHKPLLELCPHHPVLKSSGQSYLGHQAVPAGGLVSRGTIWRKDQGACSELDGRWVRGRAEIQLTPVLLRFKRIQLLLKPLK